MAFLAGFLGNDLDNISDLPSLILPILPLMLSIYHHSDQQGLLGLFSGLLCNIYPM